MAVAQARKWCRFCRTHTVHERPYFSFGVGCIVSLVTGFVFLPFWLLMSLFDSFRSWRCQKCGAAHRLSLFGREREPEGPPVINVIIQGAPQAPPPQLPASPVPRPSRSIAAPPPAPPAPAREPFDWWAFGSRVADTARGCYASVVETYRSLPEWAAPIVWGLGIAAPIVTTMVVMRALLR